MKTIVIFAVVILSLMGCMDPDTVDVSDNNAEATYEDAFQMGVDKKYKSLVSTTKLMDSIAYTFSVVSLSEFTGVDSDEVKSSNEHVLIVSIKDLRTIRDIDKLKNIQMNEEELASYLVGPVCSDLEIHQSNKVLIPKGALFEGNISDKGIVRFYLFLENYSSSKKAVVQFYDKVFGNGFIKRDLIKKN